VLLGGSAGSKSLRTTGTVDTEIPKTADEYWLRTMEKLTGAKQGYLRHWFSFPRSKQNMSIFFLNVCITLMSLGKQAYVYITIKAMQTFR
jgi:hypothetical protein